jgi:hypothetical protein
MGLELKGEPCEQKPHRGGPITPTENVICGKVPQGCSLGHLWVEGKANLTSLTSLGCDFGHPPKSKSTYPKSDLLSSLPPPSNPLGSCLVSLLQTGRTTISLDIQL